MEYTPIEKDVLSMMQRTDFKNLSKNDVISFASKLGDEKDTEIRDQEKEIEDKVNKLGS